MWHDDLSPFQGRVAPWMQECFGPVISADKVERNHRFLEEALELVQSTGCTQSEAHQLVDYVFGRAVGEPAQEVGGVMVTLAALCLAASLDMHEAAEAELARIWTKVEAIRAKQAAKPMHSPLPQAVPQWSADDIEKLLRAWPSLERYDVFYDMLERWRESRGDIGKSEWRWWWKEGDDELYFSDHASRADALAEAQREQGSAAASIEIIEARMWNDDVLDGDENIAFAESRNHEVLTLVEFEAALAAAGRA